MLSNISLPDYTRKEEMFNTISHIVGGALAIIGMIIAIIIGATRGTWVSVVSAIAYGLCMVLLYTMSSLYHGLTNLKAKKIFRILDHCSIYLMIAGTYTPILMVLIRPEYPRLAWGIFFLIWAFAILGIAMTAINLNKSSKISTIIYLVMGWASLIMIRPILDLLETGGIVLLVLGGILYSVGAVFYQIGKKKDVTYAHGVFHIFVILASVAQYLCIVLYVLPSQNPIF